MNENIFDKRRLKTFSNCKDLVKSMVGTKDGVIFYNERFRVDLETTCYKASMCEDLQKENQQLKIQLLEKKCSDKDIEYKEKIKLQQRIEKAIKYVQEDLDEPDFENCGEVYVEYEWFTKLLQILKGEEK